MITAGLPRKPGMSRDDLVATNEGIVVRRRAQGAAGISRRDPHRGLQSPRRDVRGGAPRLEASARARLRNGRRPRLGADALVHRRGAERLGREHARVRSRRPRRHDGSAAAVLDGRRESRCRSCCRRRRSTRSSSARATAGRDRQPAQDLGLVCAGLGRGRDGGGRAPRQEEDSSVRRLPPGGVRDAGHLPRRAGQARAGGNRADRRDRADARGGAGPREVGQGRSGALPHPQGRGEGGRRPARSAAASTRSRASFRSAPSSSFTSTPTRRRGTAPTPTTRWPGGCTRPRCCWRSRSW